MIRDILKSEIRNAVRVVSIYADITKVEIYKSEQFDDYASNIPLILAKSENKNAQEIGEEIKKELLKSPIAEKYIKEINIAKPGFLNISVSDNLIMKEGEELRQQLNKGFDFLKNKKINVEFISANPTGELHIGHGRGAFYGDILSNILSYAGAEVTREFYINDSKESKQIIELGKTLQEKGEQYKTSRLLQQIEELKSESNVDRFSKYGKKIESFLEKGEQDAGFALAEKIQEENINFINNKLGINFDNYFSEERNLRITGLISKMAEKLNELGLVYENDMALWLKTSISEFGDDEDRVIIRSDGTASYFLSDIAYHDEKAKRGDDVMIDVWGADHHGHVKRILAVKKMLKWKGELLIFVTQLVSIKDAGELKKMSKRLGTVIPLEELVNELGIDVVRWFYAEKALGTHMEFDMELAREQSAKNPVYYVQYAHARINSISENTKKLSSDKSTMERLMSDKSARALALKIVEFPEIIEDISSNYQIHKLITFTYELANKFSQFYRDVRIIEGDSYNQGALDLSLLAQKTLAQSLKLLGISAPERM